VSGAADGPDLMAAKRLVDLARDQGFVFQRVAPGEDGPLRGVRETVEWVDEIYLSGFWQENSCHATRRHRSSLLVPGGMPVVQQVDGDAITVLHTVVCDWRT
jgi:hypothetical protein